MSSSKNKIYEGKAKIIYESDAPDRVIQYFKDSATAFNGEKKDEFEGKGQLNCQISCRIFEILSAKGIPSHFVRQIDERQMEIERLEMIPLEVVVRNRVAGSLAKKLPGYEGKSLGAGVVEFYLKNDELKDPPVSEDLLLTLFERDQNEINELKSLALKINEILKNYFEERALILVDFKLEFGRRNGRILLGDEISPDTCRLWDAKTLEKLDKDRYRFSLGDLLQGYREVWKRMNSK